MLFLRRRLVRLWRIGFDHFSPRPPRLSAPQADDGGQVENGQQKILIILPAKP
jgi:hypothetical protein